MVLIEEARKLLEGSGYRVSSSVEDQNIFLFEDDSLFGFVSIHSDTNNLLTSWRRQQDKFLQTHATRIRESSRKAWNAYSIFLTSDKSPPETRHRLLEIEEDFRGTRKIARTDLFTPTDVLHAFLPLLPIQNIVAVRPEDWMARVRTQLALPDTALSQLLDEELPSPAAAIAIAKSLLDQP